MARDSDRLVQRSGRPVREEVGAISGSMRRSADETTTGEGSALHQLRAAVEKTTNRAENSCLMALDAAQHYNAKLFEFCKGQQRCGPQLRSRVRRRKIARGFYPDNNQARRRADRGVGGAGERAGGAWSEDCLRIRRAIQGAMVDLQNGRSQSRRYSRTASQGQR
jgi:hypothetical protein